MTYTARLKVIADQSILSQLRYVVRNQTQKKNFGGSFDSSGRTRVFPCEKLDFIQADLLLNGSPIFKNILIPALENGDFNKSIFKLPATTGQTKLADKNIQSVKVKNELEVALDKLNGTAVYFGNNFLIHDANLRAAYMREIKKMSDGYLSEVAKGKVSVKDAAIEANSLRNDILDAVRKKNSAIGLAVSQKEKAVGKSLQEIVEYYAMEIAKPVEFKQLKNTSRSAIDNHIKLKLKTGSSYLKLLSGADKNRVYYSVLKGAGKSSPKFNSKIKLMKGAGRVLVVVSIAYAGFEIYNADNKEKEAYRQGITIGGGIAGGAGGGAAAGLICGPGSPVCSTVGVLLGGVAGGLAAYVLVDEFDDELEAFTEWNLF